MSKYENKYDDTIKFLRDLYDKNEGEHSGIPECCINEFLSGTTYIKFYESLDDKDQKKLDKWNYVPCPKCFKTKKPQKPKLNGVSEAGLLIHALLAIFEQRKQNAKRSRR